MGFHIWIYVNSSGLIWPSSMINGAEEQSTRALGKQKGGREKVDEMAREHTPQRPAEKKISRFPGSFIFPSEWKMETE